MIGLNSLLLARGSRILSSRISLLFFLSWILPASKTKRPKNMAEPDSAASDSTSESNSMTEESSNDMGETSGDSDGESALSEIESLKNQLRMKEESFQLIQEENAKLQAVLDRQRQKGITHMLDSQQKRDEYLVQPPELPESGNLSAALVHALVSIPSVLGYLGSYEGQAGFGEIRFGLHSHFPPYFLKLDFPPLILKV